jgi:hypothetical protein
VGDVAIVTAMYGGSDVVRQQAPQDIDVDWICFTGEADLTAPGWKVFVAPGDRAQHPCMSAKVFKTRPGSFVPHRYVVWIDANMEVTAPSFARESLEAVHDGVAVWTHPRRHCIYEEAEASIGAESQGGKYASLPIREQVAHYRSQGYPEQGGLYACGTVAWDLSDDRAAVLGAAWMAECERWTFQDQLSFPVVCARHNVSPGLFPLPQIQRSRNGWLENDWLRIHPHL